MRHCVVVELNYIYIIKSVHAQLNKYKETTVSVPLDVY